MHFQAGKEDCLFAVEMLHIAGVVQEPCTCCCGLVGQYNNSEILAKIECCLRSLVCFLATVPCITVLQVLHSLSTFFPLKHFSLFQVT